MMNNKNIEPIMLDEVVYQDDSILIKKICFWENCNIRQDRETGLLIVTFPASKGLGSCKTGTFALPDGTRATEKEFNDIGYFREGLAKIFVEGKGYGYINTNFEIVVPPKYSRAEDFQNGFAEVTIFDEVNETKKKIFLDKAGAEHDFNDRYKIICSPHDGLFRVSTEKINVGAWDDYEEYARNR